MSAARASRHRRHPEPAPDRTAPLRAARRVQRALLALLLACAALGARDGSRDPATANGLLPVSGIPVPALAAFDQAMQDYMQARSIAAGVLGIMADGIVVFERGYGWMDQAHTAPLPPNALMRVASVSKPVTNAAIRTLAAQGVLHTTDPVFCLPGSSPACWLTIVPHGTPDPRLADVTVQHLLDHTGGWDRSLSGDPMFQSIDIAGVLGIPSPPAQRDIARYVSGLLLDHDPGTVPAYSNYGYMLLGLIVEQATGQTYTGYVQDSLFAPLGVPDTEVALGRTLPADRNPREPWYASVGTGPSVFPPHAPVPWPDGGWYLEAMEAHGGWIASSRALLAFAQAYWYDGRPRAGSGESWISFGSLDGTFAMLRWRPDGVNIAVVFNDRDHGPPHEDIWPLLDAVADGIAEWPATPPGAHKVYLPAVLRP